MYGVCGGGSGYDSVGFGSGFLDGVVAFDVIVVSSALFLSRYFFHGMALLTLLVLVLTLVPLLLLLGGVSLRTVVAVG